MRDHPYKTLPDKAFWRRSVVAPAPRNIDPVGDLKLRITPTMKVATAGSCFAQHIARHLKKSGYNYFVAETAHPSVMKSVAHANGYGLFSARYGNIYTARQLLQLFWRAFGSFTPVDDVWDGPNGSTVDPFRPSAQPGGFVSEAEMRADREWHLGQVKRMFLELDVFVFTLGLTEGWRSKADGSAYPICPGVEGGQFDPEKYEFSNQDVLEVLDDMNRFIDALRIVNPSAQVLLTVSPVPLAATAEPGAHVLTATTYSKAVLRAAAGMLVKRWDHVHYFPSYEIITSNASKGAYYADDLRNVVEAGVEHVMGLFLKHATARDENQAATTTGKTPTQPVTSAKASADFEAKAEAWVEVMCDEAGLDQS